MLSRREPTRPLAFLLNSMDRFGRTIEPCVMAVAQEIAPRAVAYGERFLGDPALSMTLFEEAAAKVSRVFRHKALTGQPEIREMRRYLFRAYLRRIGDESRRTVCRTCAAQINGPRRPHDFESRTLERHVLVRELLDKCDELTQEIFRRRLQGCSWKEIEEGCGIPANAASLRFSKALRHFRKDAATARDIRDLAIAMHGIRERCTGFPNQ
jgi:DNA-directed RNA polymerase specialized sigma24 family protein